MMCEAENVKRLAIVYMAVSFQLLLLALNVVERDEIDHGLVDRDLVPKVTESSYRNRRQAFSRRAPCFNRVGCDRVGPRPTIRAPSPQAAHSADRWKAHDGRQSL